MLVRSGNAAAEDLAFEDRKDVLGRNLYCHICPVPPQSQ